MIAPAIRTEIMLRLAEAEHDVRILVAIESGRRASPILLLSVLPTKGASRAGRLGQVEIFS